MPTPDISEALGKLRQAITESYEYEINALRAENTALKAALVKLSQDRVSS